MNIFKKIAKCLLIILLIILKIMLINKLIYVFAKMNAKEQVNQRSNYYEWRFGKIHYTVVGSGKPILLIHSLNTGSSLYEYNKLVKRLSRHFKVFAIDLIGFGKSDRPKITYTAYLYVQLIHDFIKDVIEESTDIVTSGDTNSFVTMMALQNKNYIKRIVSINPGNLDRLSMYPGFKNIVLKKIIEFPVIGTTIYNIITSKQNIKNSLYKKYFFNTYNISKNHINSFYSSSHYGDHKNKYIYASKKCNYLNVNIDHALELINNSIYIIQGEYRNSDYLIINESYKSLNPSIECTVIHNTKEYPHLEKPDATSELIHLFCH